MSTELLRLLSEATHQPPWIRPWGRATIHAWGLDGVENDTRSLDLAIAAVNALPDLLAVVDAARRGPRQAGRRPMTDDAVIQAARAAWAASPRRVLVALAGIVAGVFAGYVLLVVAIVMGTPQ
jgi:hypothetical protein